MFVITPNSIGNMNTYRLNIRSFWYFSCISFRNQTPILEMNHISFILLTDQNVTIHEKK